MTYILVTTKYLGPTDFKGARLKASARGRNVTIPFPYEIGAVEGHREVAQRLVDAHWPGRTLVGPAPHETGYAWLAAS